ncbi:MAG: hypothetical protein KAT25_05530 [Sulfuriflexus sp.]|nr:hypothetical protein [Sulfuriflexus sp.]
MFLTGCSTTTPPSGDTVDPNTELSYLAKSDIDTVADIHLQQVDQYLKELSYKLYRRNPRHCAGGTAKIGQCVTRLFNSQNNKKLAVKKAITNIKLSFDEQFKGDRVGNFVLGLRSMIHRAYSDKTEFFFFDELDPQKLYNSARNIEIAVWRLSNYRDDKGKLFLLTNGLNTRVVNLSFERLFGKLVATQDTIAAIIAESSRRRIKNVIQRLATAVFLPI